MNNTDLVFKNLIEIGQDSFIGVPCSYFNGIINSFYKYNKLFIANNEGEAVAIAAGRKLAGGNPVVFFQNSGFGNALNPITSLILTNKIPILFMISLRGDTRLKDEPQHTIMGKVTKKILDEIGIKNQILDSNINLKRKFKKISQILNNGESYALIVRKNFFEKVQNLTSLKKTKPQKVKYISKNTGGKIKREDSLKIIKKNISGSSCVVTSTGYLSREIYSLGDSEQNFYMVGAMGCSLAISLGISTIIKKSKIFCIDGDGALLMRLGVMTNIFNRSSKNLIHILINNESHSSTGGQYTNSQNINFLKIADACGFKNVACCNSISELKNVLSLMKKTVGPNFLEIKVRDGKFDSLLRPSISPNQVYKRFSNFLKALK